MELLKTPPTVTTKLRCPIDVYLLEEYEKSPNGQNVYYSSKKYTTKYTGKTVATIIYEFLSHINRCEKDDQIGYIDICYKLPRRTEALVQAGWLTGGREYAIGPDPFQLPK